jgi:hypothetical protein
MRQTRCVFLVVTSRRQASTTTGRSYHRSSSYWFKLNRPSDSPFRRSKPLPQEQPTVEPSIGWIQALLRPTLVATTVCLTSFGAAAIWEYEQKRHAATAAVPPVNLSTPFWNLDLETKQAPSTNIEQETPVAQPSPLRFCRRQPPWNPRNPPIGKRLLSHCPHGSWHSHSRRSFWPWRIAPFHRHIGVFVEIRRPSPPTTNGPPQGNLLGRLCQCGIARRRGRHCARSIAKPILATASFSVSHSKGTPRRYGRALCSPLCALLFQYRVSNQSSNRPDLGERIWNSGRRCPSWIGRRGLFWIGVGTPSLWKWNPFEWGCDWILCREYGWNGTNQGLPTVCSPTICSNDGRTTLVWLAGKYIWNDLVDVIAEWIRRWHFQKDHCGPLKVKMKQEIAHKHGPTFRLYHPLREQTFTEFLRQAVNNMNSH